jgi:hypothetical protein
MYKCLITKRLECCGISTASVNSNPQSIQETIMHQLIRGGAIAVALLGSVSFAAAQRAPDVRPDLTANQQQAVSQGLASSPSQPAPSGEQPQVGNKLPDSMSAQSVPSDVSDQVPETKNLLFVKLPDRIVLIDPDNQLVTQIVMDSTTMGPSTTGSNSGGSMTNTSDRPSR